MAPALLTAVDAAFHIHLIVGSNPLAAARCSRSIEVGAKPIIVAPEDATLHYGLAKRIEDGQVQWLRRSFHEDDLITLGRPDVDGIVDAVFVTADGKGVLGGHLCVLTTALTNPTVSHKNIGSVSPPSHSSQRRRRPESLLVHLALYPHRRTLADWRDNVR